MEMYKITKRDLYNLMLRGVLVQHGAHVRAVIELFREDGLVNVYITEPDNAHSLRREYAVDELDMLLTGYESTPIPLAHGMAFIDNMHWRGTKE